MRSFASSMIILVLSLVGGCGGGGGGSSAPATQPQTSAPPTQAADTSAPPESLPLAETAPPAAQTEVRVLALYTPAVAERYTDPLLRAEHLFNVANDVIRDSAIDLEINLVALLPVEYPDAGDLATALDDLTYSRHPALAEVADLRNEYEADLVTMLHPYSNDGRCGIAWITGFDSNGDFSGAAEFGYSVVAASCSDYTLIHELGHNLGLAHSRREDPQGGSLPHGVGYGVEDAFVTIMASPNLFSAPRLPRLSNPLQQCQGMPCGISAADSVQGADAASAINRAKDQVAAFR
ncbi:MAG: M12 family metallo-peptidase [Pseudomonadales bacterium]